MAAIRPSLPRLGLSCPTPDEVRVISDLHIGAGRLQDFICTDELLGFLDDFSGPGHLLVVNGDLFDFPQTLPEIEPENLDPRIGATEAQSLERFKEIRHENRRVFRGLRSFVASGACLVVQPGNHDIDLVWPMVRDAFTQSVDPEETGRFACRSTLPLVLWDRVWIEHGNQWSIDGNAFERWWSPFVVSDTGDRHLEQCWGTWFIRHFINKVEVSIPYIDNVWPFTRIISLVRRHEPVRMVLLLRDLYRTIASTVARPPTQLGDGTDEFRSARQQQQFWDLYREIQSSFARHMPELLRPHDLPTGWRGLVRQPRSAWAKRLKQSGFLTALEQIDRRLQRHENEISRFVYAQIVLGWQVGLAGNLVADQEFGARDLCTAFDGVELVLFGHSHIARDVPVFDARGEETIGRYINTGTWIPYWMFQDSPDLPSPRALADARLFPFRLTYASVERGSDGAIEAGLHVWRESPGLPEFQARPGAAPPKKRVRA